MIQVAHKSNATNHNDDGSITRERVTMHVQGISHWAPANIGPYSQAIKVENHFFIDFSVRISKKNFVNLG